MRLILTDTFIRNFAIIAHIDHGKSTLADRLIEYCEGVSKREMKEQILDSMEIERERGITIKAQTVRLEHVNNDNKYTLNLIDTPGHVDFSYEVSRSMAACEGALLIVDATQGVEAQTLANAWLAIEANLEIIPVLNKVDLASSDVDRVKSQIKELIGIETDDTVSVSAKTGQGIKDLLQKIIYKCPYPKGKDNGPLKALLIDSWYDSYLGVMVLIRVKNGFLKKNMKIKLLISNTEYQIEKVGVFTPKPIEVDLLKAGEVGFITANIKETSQAWVGDTIVESRNPNKLEPLPGFKPSVPVVFCGLYPLDANEYDSLKVSLGKLKLNDSSFTFENESSAALGLGFRCGFLGLLHLEIIQERLKREFGLDLIVTPPSVVYKIIKTDNEQKSIHNPAEWPNQTKIKQIKEPWIKASIFSPETYIGPIIQLCSEKRGIQKEINFTGNRVLLEYFLPLNEVIFDFHDKLKSISKGYGSFDYEMSDYRDGALQKVSILVNGEIVEGLSFITHIDKATARGRVICNKLKESIPKQLFKIAIQASIGSKIIARETLSSLRKDVIAKCYGGDVTRKRKLLDKQKAGKKKMKQVGNVNIPQEAFLAAIKLDN
ncbi:MAG: Elongation factor 4 [Alphaproteobacteria bacterium MarineAlpha9_Bin4]|nr:elongation factor 4 [Pelagibacterales bacterium]PPR27417.1 MAG: Elongation factor 4 [Alphaproteobacteria bacterium MarineAlpha9_Bin4]|tara:strand:+ start:360 stop:2168 length:1809 start_codon:yes stop_codon:yes gene_type:complete